MLHLVAAVVAGWLIASIFRIRRRGFTIENLPENLSDIGDVVLGVILAVAGWFNK